MDIKKFKYMNSFNTMNNKQFSCLQEYLKETKDRNTEIPSSPRIYTNNQNALFSDNNDNNRTVTSTTDSTIDNPKTNYIYRKNVIKQKNKIFVHRNLANLNEIHKFQNNLKSRFARCSSSDNLKLNQNVLHS